MALTADQRVMAVGKNWSGQLGTGNRKRTEVFRLVSDGPWQGSTTMLACGSHFSVLLAHDGRVWTCGLYASYCLGVTPEDADALDHTNSNDRLEPTPMIMQQPNQHPISFVAAGHAHVLAVAGGDLFSWGHNSSAQLGLGDFEPHWNPTRVGGAELFGSPVRIVSANKCHTLALTENRELWGFGNAEHGRLGMGAGECKTLEKRFIKTPMQIDSSFFGNHRIATVAAGCGHSAVVTEEGCMYTWGQGKHNEWRYEVPSALAHIHEKSFQDVPLMVQAR